MTMEIEISQARLTATVEQLAACGPDLAWLHDLFEAGLTSITLHQAERGDNSA